VGTSQKQRKDVCVADLANNIDLVASETNCASNTLQNSGSLLLVNILTVVGRLPIVDGIRPNGNAG
jgi:hypothetical protein